MLSLIAQSSRKTLALFACLAALLMCLKLINLDEWLFNNDNFATLGTFFSSASYPDFRQAAHAYHERAVAACDKNDSRCIGAATLAFGEQTYTRPIIAFFGSSLPRREWLSSDAGFIGGVTTLTVGHVVAATIIALLLMLCFVLALPPPAGAFVAGVTALLGFLSYWLFLPAPYRDFQLLQGVGPGGALASFLLAAGLCFAATRPSLRAAAFKGIEGVNAIRFFWLAALALVFLRVAAMSAPEMVWSGQWFGSGVGPFPLILLAAGVAVFFCAIALAAGGEHADPSVLWISAFLLLGFVTAGKGLFASAFHITAKGSIYLLAAPIMLYAAFRPNGRMLLLLPALALFHVTIAGIFYGCMAATEAFACLRRRKVSLALLISTLLFFASVAFTMWNSANSLGAAGADAISNWIWDVKWWFRLPGLVVLTILACAGILAWRMHDPAGDLLLRAIVLAAILTCGGQVSVTLADSGFAEAGYDLIYPSVFMLILLPNYLGPIACDVGIFLVIFALGTLGRRPGTQGPGFDWRAMSIALAGIVALAAVRGENVNSRPGNPLAAMAVGARMVATQNPAEPIRSDILAVASPDDDYLVGQNALDAVSMASILKMKARAAAGLLDPARMTVTPLKAAP